MSLNIKNIYLIHYINSMRTFIAKKKHEIFMVDCESLDRIKHVYDSSLAADI